MAGNENLAANYGDMHTAVAQFNAKYTEFEQALTQINSAIDQLGATWVGQGYQSFQAAMAKWHGEANTLAAPSSASKTTPIRPILRASPSQASPHRETQAIHRQQLHSQANKILHPQYCIPPSSQPSLSRFRCQGQG